MPFLFGCSDIDGDPLAWIGPGPPFKTRPKPPEPEPAPVPAQAAAAPSPFWPPLAQAETQAQAPVPVAAPASYVNDPAYAPAPVSAGAPVYAQTTNYIPAPSGLLAAVKPFEAKPNGMHGTLGLNLSALLAEDIQDPQQRIKRLEQTVIAMHRDMEVMASALQGGDYSPPPAPVYSPPPQPVYTPPPPPVYKPPPAASIPPAPPTPELELIASSEPQSILKKEDTAPAPLPVAAATSEPQLELIASSDGGSSMQVRVGEHPDKMRIVLDVPKGTTFSADLDNSENILVIELPSTNWSGPASESFSKMPLIKSYKVSPSGGGSMVVVQLSGPASVINQAKYPALSGGGERIVIDLAR